ncbi:hypothetical protein F2Q69_00030578 [Brassica cretica]|uniref:Uncharacterized protein n=1 Tax=Brassica cretica TaxID=69181 RepID=A0A8S9S231_BRACR|nr:hypothetical protein F2Q69_00030578 [Brassica cretica]
MCLRFFENFASSLFTEETDGAPTMGSSATVLPDSSSYMHVTELLFFFDRPPELLFVFHPLPEILLCCMHVHLLLLFTERVHNSPDFRLG